MRAKIIGAVVVLWWAVMMASLIHRYMPGGAGRDGAPPLDTATLADAWRDTDEWMELRWNGLPVGIMRTAARRLSPSDAPPPDSSNSPDLPDSTNSPDSAAAPADHPKAPASPATDSPESSTKFPAAAPDSKPPAAADATNAKPPKTRFQVVVLIAIHFGPFHARASTSALLNERLILDQFSLRLDLGALDSPGHTELRVDGVARGTALLVRLQRGDTRQFREVKLTRPVSLAEGLAPLYSRSDLHVGDTYTLPVFDPIWNMQGGTMTVHVADRERIAVEGKEVETLRIETSMGNVKTTTWVDDTGQVLKREVPPLAMTAIPPEQALKKAPWMAKLPPPPNLKIDDMQGKEYGEPLGSNGLLGLLRGALNPPDTEQNKPAERKQSGP